ncbi:MaoC/PaaZ C-terminal domain-containing protein [Phaeacidiphilus oryzae]|uniref:MaoC/PaaZ C-terminal domain-containing protein n=1 Tax=Phaeacidiphilus oryzae TaxID=348818 RepID=UPI00055CD287|nr:MaoC/PaaZ C-terminal domain-containing protein [Phaeacidiphilus oryzae]
MSLDLDAVGRTAGPTEVSWTSTDALLYALGVGAGQDDPLAELELTTENTAGIEQRVLPSYAIVLGQRGPHTDLGDFDRSKLVHAEQALTLHRPLPVAGRVRLTAEVTGIQDKGSGALVTSATTAEDPETGEALFTSESSVFIRGEGGFGGERTPSPPWAPPERDPDHATAVTIRHDQALLYRLSGDRNPLHSDPGFAARGGFPRPILHGMCTYGTTVRVLLRAVGADPRDCASVTGRFTKPVLPGEKLTVQVWSEGGRHWFRTSDSEGAVVLDRGLLTLRDGAGSGA